MPRHLGARRRHSHLFDLIRVPRRSRHGKGIQGRQSRFRNSEAGHVTGRIVKVHTTDVNYKEYVHHASKHDPQYEIKSDETDHITLHKGAALKLLHR